MPVYTSHVSSLGTSDLKELLDSGAVENVRLEFKRNVPEKDETLKKLTSFANTFGGFVIVGASADSADGRLQDMSGVEEESGYKQKIVQWCTEGVNPPLTVEVSDPIPTPSANDKFCYVISIAESDLAPHFINGRKGLWIRTDEFSHRFDAKLAEERELRQLLDRRKIINERKNDLIERAKSRFETHVKNSMADRSGSTGRVGPILQISFTPRFPSRKFNRQTELKKLVPLTGIFWGQRTFPDPGKPVILQHESAIALSPTRRLSYFEASEWGMVFYGAELNLDHNNALGIHIGEFVGTVLLFVAHAGKILEKMKVVGPMEIEVTLNSLRGTPWLNPQQSWLSTLKGSELDDIFGIHIPTKVEAIRDSSMGIAAEILRYALCAVNWPETVESDEKTATLIRLGYAFNNWPLPNAIDVSFP